MSRTRRLLIEAARDDQTFEERELSARRYLVGRCIHCNRRVSVPLDPNEPAHATLEHIVPKNHGGDDHLSNLAVACARCNQGKGMRLDNRHREDPTAQRVIATLQARRQERSRGHS